MSLLEYIFKIEIQFKFYIKDWLELEKEMSTKSTRRNLTKYHNKVWNWASYAMYFWSRAYGPHKLTKEIAMNNINEVIQYYCKELCLK